MKESCLRLRCTAGKFVMLIVAMTLRWTASAQERRTPPILTDSEEGASTVTTVQTGTLTSVDLDIQSWKHVHRDSVLAGTLTMPIYAGQEPAVPEGASMRFTIQSIDKFSNEAGIWKKIGRGIVRAFNPLERSVAPEYRVEIRGAEIIAPTGQKLPITAEVLWAGTGRMIRAYGEKSGRQDSLLSAHPASHRNVEKPHSRMVLRFTGPLESYAPNYMPSEQRRETVREGRARAFLLNDLRASRNRDGDFFQAVIAEPVSVGGHVFPVGSLLEGFVARTKPPRMLSRAGSLSLHFNRLTSGADIVTIDGTLSEVEVGPQNDFALDDEGRLAGRKPGIKRAVMDLAVAYIIGKGADDLAETPIRAIGAATSDAAVASAARYFGLGASAAFLITRHGRDVYVPKYAELEVEFNRIVIRRSKERQLGDLERSVPSVRNQMRRAEEP